MLLTATADTARILGFDLQLLVQMVIQGVTALALFNILGRLMFKPVRGMLKKRRRNSIKITQIIGAVLDIQFESNRLPAL